MWIGIRAAFDAGTRGSVLAVADTGMVILVSEMNNQKRLLSAGSLFLGSHCKLMVLGLV